MSKFDAAIALLRERDEWCYFPDSFPNDGFKPGWAESAIRLLEAAGRVDKNATISFLDGTWDRDERLYGEIGLIGSAEHKERKPLRTLLSALPED